MLLFCFGPFVSALSTAQIVLYLDCFFITMTCQLVVVFQSFSQEKWSKNNKPFLRVEKCNRPGCLIEKNTVMHRITSQMI